MVLNDADFEFIGVELGIIRIISDEMRLGIGPSFLKNPIGANMHTIGEKSATRS